MKMGAAPKEPAHGDQDIYEAQLGDVEIPGRPSAATDSIGPLQRSATTSEGLSGPDYSHFVKRLTSAEQCRGEPAGDGARNHVSLLAKPLLSESRCTQLVSHHAVIQLTAILVLDVSSELVSWRLHVPSILLLLLTGVVASPVTGFLKPDELFGDLLLPIVSVAVSIILFEGGLGLNLRELRDIDAVLFRLTSLSVAVSWLINTLAAHFILDFRWGLVGLLGSILVVTGPTVIGPLLRQLRLGGRVGPLLRWEKGY